MIVVADLGELKVYMVESSEAINRQDSSQVSHSQQHGDYKESAILKSIKDINYIEPHLRVQDKVSDNKGRFGISSGERHNMKIEMKSRILKAISEDILKLVEENKPHQIYFAFPKETNKQIMEKFEPKVKEAIVKNITLNLTKTDQNMILSHFK